MYLYVGPILCRGIKSIFCTDYYHKSNGNVNVGTFIAGNNLLLEKIYDDKNWPELVVSYR